jgi:hypothetical protein
MTMKSNIVRCAAAVLLASALSPNAARADEPESHVRPLPEPVALTTGGAHAFAAMAGSWSGGGTIALTGEIQERLRCRANHSFGQSNNSLALNIRCASDNYKFELTSNVVERRGQISGNWREASYNVSGSINGRVAGNRILAVAQGDNFITDLSVTTSGNRQSVSITPKNTYIISVQIALSRR